MPIMMEPEPPPVKTPEELRREDQRFANRLRDFAARYPYVGWILALLVAPYLFYLAWKESKKP